MARVLVTGDEELARPLRARGMSSEIYIYICICFFPSSVKEFGKCSNVLMLLNRLKLRSYQKLASLNFVQDLFFFIWQRRKKNTCHQMTFL